MGAYLSFGAQIALDQLAGDDAEVALLGPFLSYEDASELVTALLRRFPDLGLVLVHENHAEIEEWVSEMPIHSVLSPTADDETVVELLRQMRAWLIEAGDVDEDAPEYGAIPPLEDSELNPVAEETEVPALVTVDDVHEDALSDEPEPLAAITTIASPDGEEGRVIAVVSPKGGLGKTTIATNLAVGLARVAPLSVVIVDADVQFGDVATALALEPEHTLPDMVGGLAPRDTMVLKTFLTVHPSGFYVVAGAEDPAAGDRVTGDQIGHLVRQLAGIFRFVIVDTAPGLGEHALSALECASDAIVLCTMSVPSVRGLRQELATLAALGILPAERHVVMNFADKVSGLNAQGRRGDHRCAGGCRNPALECRCTLDQPGGSPLGAGFAGSRGEGSEPDRCPIRQRGRAETWPSSPEGGSGMKLTERIDALRGVTPANAEAPAETTPEAASATAVIGAIADAPPPVTERVRHLPAPVHVDPLAELKERAAQELFERIGTRMNDSSLTEEKLHAYARAELSQIVSEEQSPAQRARSGSV